jgi:hypothetical protein
MDEQDEGYVRLKREADVLRVANERLRGQLDEVRHVVRSGIPIDREEALAAWRRLEAACQI